MELRWRGLELCLVLMLLATISGVLAEESVITLDHSNFADIVSKHDFILVEFYAPWCGFCKKLAPEYEKAAATLSKHDPPITLAKVDLDINENKEHFKTMFDIKGFPTLKILRNGGKVVHDVETPQSAHGIVELVEKFLGPASVEIKSYADSSKYIDEKKTFVAGVFTKFEGEEYENFTKLADKLRSEYVFGHTLDAKFLPRGDSYVKGPIVRFLKPFDERYADSKNFGLDALEKFIKEEDVPSVVQFNMDPSNTYLRKIFSDQKSKKVMMILDFKSKDADAFKSKFSDIAVLLKGGDKHFIIGDLEDSKEVLEFFKLDQSHAPFIFILETEAEKYLKTNLKPDEVAPWLRKYLDGKLEMFMKSEPIPLENNEPVKVVVLDSLQEMVFNSEKDVFLEFYAPWCGHCKKLAPILEEVAVSYEKDSDILIAKYDKSQNDIPSEHFKVEGVPTMFFIKKNKEIIEYNGGRTKEDLVSFIEEHRSDKKSKSEPQKTSDHVDDETVSAKDEL